MSDIELKLKQIESMSKLLAQEGDRLSEEIRQFQNQIAKINPHFSKAIQISDTEWIGWDCKQKYIAYHDEKTVGQLSSASIPVRRKSITYFSLLLDAILEGYTQYMEGAKQKKVLKPIESPPANDEVEGVVLSVATKKIKRRKTKKVKRAKKAPESVEAN